MSKNYTTKYDAEFDGYYVWNGEKFINISSICILLNEKDDCIEELEADNKRLRMLLELNNQL